MKYIIYSLSLILSHYALAVEDPAELTKLRSGWEKARDEAVKPVDHKYRKALNKLRTKYMKGGNLEAAIIVDSEIKKLFPVKQPKPDADGSEFRLVSATYGSGRTRVDVIERLKKNVKDGKLNIVVNRKYLGDPIPYYKKYLAIKYSYKGKSVSKNFHEGAKVQIP